jgi:hypothetical protein
MADVGLVLAAVLIWLVIVRWVWQRRVLQRYFGSSIIA